MTAEAGRVHAVLVTYRRHEFLVNYLEELAAQTASFGRLVVVDNEASPTVEEIVAGAASVAQEVLYVGMDNVGPAGAIATGMDLVLEVAEDEDWIVVLDDDDPPRRRDTLDAVRRAARETLRDDPSVGAVGLWGARLNRRTGRLRVATAEMPERVDYVSGGSYPHYRVAALRIVGTGRPELFFGFDDLELGLRLAGGGFSVYSSGLASVHGFGHHVERSRASVLVGAATWRRYYSLRNLVHILRTHQMFGAALFMSFVAGLAKPLLNSVVQPRTAVQNLRLNVAAVRDGWLGRLGRTRDPS